MRGLKRGMRVRVLGGDHFGRIGVIRDVSPNLSRLETESDVQVLEIELDGFGLVVVPKSNVEPIE
jgi:transcription elongation factor